MRTMLRSTVLTLLTMGLLLSQAGGAAASFQDDNPVPDLIFVAEPEPGTYHCEKVGDEEVADFRAALLLDLEETEYHCEGTFVEDGSLCEYVWTDDDADEDPHDENAEIQFVQCTGALTTSTGNETGDYYCERIGDEEVAGFRADGLIAFEDTRYHCEGTFVEGTRVCQYIWTDDDADDDPHDENAEILFVRCTGAAR